MTEHTIPIGRAAEILGVSIFTLRRWDEAGMLRSLPRPDKSNRPRMYRASEVERLKTERTS